MIWSATRVGGRRSWFRVAKSVLRPIDKTGHSQIEPNYYVGRPRVRQRQNIWRCSFESLHHHLGTSRRDRHIDCPLKNCISFIGSSRSSGTVSVGNEQDTFVLPSIKLGSSVFRFHRQLLSSLILSLYAFFIVKSLLTACSVKVDYFPFASVHLFTECFHFQDCPKYYIAQQIFNSRCLDVLNFLSLGLSQVSLWEILLIYIKIPTLFLSC